MQSVSRLLGRRHPVPLPLSPPSLISTIRPLISDSVPIRSGPKELAYGLRLISTRPIPAVSGSVVRPPVEPIAPSPCSRSYPPPPGLSYDGALEEEWNGGCGGGDAESKRDLGSKRDRERPYDGRYESVSAKGRQ
ncbi:hypothetical protein BDV93DRAFT_559246 [Ceratobasidium sp. AG-I]|nr:hypothetical protein BDV93DRAFT_559246 [Ceratobasidium sp. AG-I]